jgi:XTP/dITP diphosphohydrolase
MQEIVIASGNRGKINEIALLIAPLGLRLVSQNELGVPEAEETGITFVENALIKARQAARHTGKPALADDSGLEVDALGGLPGVRSARFAGESATDADNNRLLLERLEQVPSHQRSARFHCVLVYLRHADDPTPLICHGIWEGRITMTPKGQNGFGYDPLFFIPELNCTSAELDAATKNRLSHRGKALAQWVEAMSR